MGYYSISEDISVLCLLLLTVTPGLIIHFEINSVVSIRKMSDF